MNTEERVEVNRAGWRAIGKHLASPQLNYTHFSGALEQFVKALPPGGRVLDLGCGAGAVAKPLASCGLQVVGVDFADEMVIAARSVVPEGTFLQRSMTDIDFVAEFDGVVASYSLLCLTPGEFRIVARKIARALKPHGWCFVALNEPHPGEDQDGTAVSEIAGQQVYCRAYQESEVREAFKDFQIVHVARQVIRSEAYGDEKSIVFLMHA